MTTKVDSKHLAELEAQLTGSLSLPQAPEYQEAIYTWNAWIRHKPDFVVSIANAADAQTAFRFAAKHCIPVAVQSAGHGAVMAIDGGMLISTRHLKKLGVDPGTRTATVGAGVKWSEVIRAAAPYGLAGASGSASDVGVVGYTLGGGMSIIGRKFGWGADRVKSVEIVTPDARLRRLDADTEPDLFSAVCGGAGNFGVVTEITFELVQLSTVYAGGIFYDGTHALSVMNKYLEWAKELPDEMCSAIALIWMPPTPDVPEPLRGKPVINMRVCYVGDATEGEKLLAPMRKVAPALIDSVSTIPWTAYDSIYMDPKDPIPFQQRGALFREVSGETIDALLKIAGPDTKIPMIILDLRHLGGAFCRGPAAGNAVCGRDASYMLSVVALSTPDTAEAARHGIDGIIEAVAPWCTGRIFVNSAGLPSDEANRARSWEEGTYRKIVSLVKEVDPHGLIQYGFAVGRSAAMAQA